MRKRIFTSLLTIVFIFSMSITSFANENDINDVLVTDEGKIEESTEEIVEEYILNENDNIQVKTIPILRNNENSFDTQAVSMMSLNDVSFVSTGVNPVITGAYSEDFYADSTMFEINLRIENMSDTRQKLKLAVVDENNIVVAQQTGVYYQQNGLVYQMKLIKKVDEYSDYHIQFSYTGKYDLKCETSNASICPVTHVAIKNVEVINSNENSFRIELANVSVGTQYTLFYEEEGHSTSVKKDATVTSDKSLYVEFGDSIAFSRYN